jgi:uridine kinase
MPRMQQARAGAVERLGTRIQELRPRAGTVLIGLDGRGASGKSTLARALAGLLGATTIVELDDFYRPTATRLAPGHPDIGGDFEWRRLRDQVLVPLSQGRSARYQRYDWPTDALAEWHAVPTGGRVIVEGNYSTRRELHAFYDLRVWLQAPHPVRLGRGRARGGLDSERLWLDVWMPEEERYLAADDAPARADVVIDTTPEADAAGLAYRELHDLPGNGT